jgi:hypothetical protein
VLTSACFTEESIEGVVTSANSFIARHLTIRLNTMFEAKKFPTSVADLNASLSEVKAESLTHGAIVVARRLCSSSFSGADKKASGAQ